jgi:flagellar biosynthesis component FlhA
VGTLEALVDAAATTREPRELAETLRRRLVPAQLRRRNLDALEPLLLAPALETDLRSWLLDGTLAPQPEYAVRLRAAAAAYVARVPRERAALICGAALRAPLAELLQSFGLRLDVFAYAELPAELELRPAAVLDASALASDAAQSAQRPAMVNA